MEVKQSPEEKHIESIAKQVNFAQQHTPFYGFIRLRKDRTNTDIFQGSVPGLIKSIKVNGTKVLATVDSGNEAIGEKDHEIPIEDIDMIDVSRDINLKVIFNDNIT